MIVGENIFSSAQDVVYVATRGKTLFPKHGSIAYTVDHATRSKSLIQLLIAKVSGGIVRITHIDAAQDRWCLTYNKCAIISDDTLRMFGQQHDETNDNWTHMDAGKPT